MIVATHMGMYMPALRPDWEKCIERGEPELQVRSRRLVDLANLREFAQRWGIRLGPTVQLPRTDYQFRAYCTRAAWGQLLANLALDIDYVKFKDTPAKKHGDIKLKNCYEAMWGAIFRAFPTGSVYDYTSKQRRANVWPRQTGKTEHERVVETVYRTESREWRMNGASARELADLMREIDEATDGVDTDALIRDADEWLNDHSKCTHSDSKSARRRCRQKRIGE